MISPSKKAKEKEKIFDEIDLNTKIVIPNRDQSNVIVEQMEILSEIWMKRAQKRKLNAKRDRGKVLEDIKDIFLDVMQIEINNKTPIIKKLVDIVHKFNKDIDGEVKLLQRVERKFENKILENVAKKIAIDQVESSTLISTLEGVVNNVVSLFKKLCDTLVFTK